MSGQHITFEVEGKAVKGYLALPSQSSAPGILVLHAWWGLNPFFERLCDKLAAEGFVAFAPDLNEGKIATTVGEAEQIMSELGPDRKHAIVAAAPDYLRGRSEVQPDMLSLIGFSMGAAWALALASEQPEEVRKVVLFYGVGDADFARIKAEVLGHFSDVDEWEPLEGIRAVEAGLRAAGLEPSFHIYSQMAHWFFEDDRPEFDAQAAELAWNRTLEFLRR